jgi:long-chain acyl-CoA synthetase
MIEGHNRAFNIAIVSIDKQAVTQWAEKQGLSTDDLAKQREVRELIEHEVEEQSADFKRFEKPRALIITDDEWCPENGMLTPTLKLKRRVVCEEYADRIEQIYKEADSD